MKVVKTSQSPWATEIDGKPVICMIVNVGGQQIEVRGVIGNPLYFTEQVIERVLNPAVKILRVGKPAIR